MCRRETKDAEPGEPATAPARATPIAPPTWRAVLFMAEARPPRSPGVAATAADDAALATIDVLGAGTVDVQKQIVLMLLLRIRLAEATSMGEPDFN